MPNSSRVRYLPVRHYNACWVVLFVMVPFGVMRGRCQIHVQSFIACWILVGGELVLTN